MRQSDLKKADGRLDTFVTTVIREYLSKHKLSFDANNELLDIAARFRRLLSDILAELEARDKSKIDVDYLNSHLARVNLSDVESPYWLKGTIAKERPPGPTNSEISALIKRITARLSQAEGIELLEREKVLQHLVYEIRNTFTLPNQNLPFTERLYDRSPHLPWDVTQNTPCEICAENRATDICHIIPRALGGSRSPANTIYLCPTHHRLFDRFMLTRDEWERIDFTTKSKTSANYAYFALGPRMEEFWRRVQAGSHQKRGTYDTAPVETDRAWLKSELRKEVISYLNSSPGSTLEGIENKTAVDTEQARKLVIELKKSRVVKERRRNGRRTFFVTQGRDKDTTG